MASPDAFITTAEDTGLIEAIDIRVLEMACHQLREWQEQYPQRHLTIATNLAGRELTRPDLADQVEGVLRDTGIEPALVQLEITETATLGNLDELIATLTRLKRLGVRLAIDDFGTGYSSLSYIHHMPLDTIKIDRGFVTALDHKTYSRRLVETILQMAHGLGLETIAEGVERDTHAEILRTLGCRAAQGFFYSPPVDAGHATALLARPPFPGPGASGTPLRGSRR